MSVAGAEDEVIAHLGLAGRLIDDQVLEAAGLLVDDGRRASSAEVDRPFD